MAATFSVDELIQRYDSLVSQRRLWETTWARIAKLTLPRKSGLQFYRSAGARTENQYTSTAIRANELLAASMQGSLTSSIVRWFSIGDGNPATAKNKAVAKWYDDFSERLYRNLTKSNFHQEMQEVYLDLGAFGTGAIFMLEKKTPGLGFGGFQFQAQEIATYVVAEDGEGHVDTVFRVLRMSPRAAASRWGREAIGTRLQTLLGGTDTADPMVDILHGVFPREGVKGYRPGTPAKKLPYASCYIDVEGKHKIEDSGFHEQPAFIPRWTKVSGETYGRGPGFTALGDASTLDEAVKLNLQAWALAIRPPLLRRHDGVIGTPKAVPGGFIDVYDMEALAPLASGAQHNVQVVERQALQDDIRNIFFWEQLQLPNQQIYTATEVQRRLELMQRVLGPTLGRIEIELHQPVILRGAAMMLRAGLRSRFQDPAAAPEPPPEVAEALARGLAEVTIEYLGPLARAQKAVDAESVSSTLQLAAPIIQIAPDAAAVYNFEEWLRFIAERRGLPPHLVRSKEEVTAIQDAQKAAREDAAQDEKMKTISETARNASPLLDTLGGSTEPGFGAQ